jgi:4-hydroxysphinganine ceramide fatty acyl 2-hydroxylase
MFLTFLKHGSNALIAGAIVLILISSGLGGIALSPWATLIGTGLFFLTEYGTHRYVLHARPAQSPFVLRLQRRLHYDHHKEPSRLDLLFLPWWALIPALGVFGIAYLVITRSTGFAWSLVLGNLFGLVYYEWVHYVAHIPFQPVTPFGRWIKKYHLWHHFKNEHLWYGVTNPAMDVLARTYARVDDAQRSDSTRNLWNR